MSEPLTLDVLSLDEVQRVRIWRAQFPYALRTPTLLTEEQQAEFYRTVVSNRLSPHRYWAVRGTMDQRRELYAQVGLVNLEWENGLGEISLITNPQMVKIGIGAQAVFLVLEEAFDRMRLHTVWGECYACNPAIDFWKLMVERFHGTSTTWPRRKWWDGKLWPSYLFTFSVESWKGEA